MTDVKICSTLFDLIDDKELRAEYPILYSKYAVEKHDDDSYLLRWTAWCVNKGGGSMFKEITAADHILVENWLLRLTDREFKEAIRAVSEHDNDGLIMIISSLDEPETSVVRFDLDGLAKAISAYNQIYSGPDIGREVCEWFGDEVVDLNIFPSLIHPMLMRSIDEFKSEEVERDAENRRKRLEFELTSLEFGLRLKPGRNAVEAIDGLGKGLAVVYGARRSSGSSDFLKGRAFSVRLDQMKSDGCRIIDLQGIFAGEQTRAQLCYGLSNISENEAFEFIRATEIRVGLYVNQQGNCKIIDLDA